MVKSIKYMAVFTAFFFSTFSNASSSEVSIPAAEKINYTGKCVVKNSNKGYMTYQDCYQYVYDFYVTEIGYAYLKRNKKYTNGVVSYEGLSSPSNSLLSVWNNTVSTPETYCDNSLYQDLREENGEWLCFGTIYKLDQSDVDNFDALSEELEGTASIRFSDFSDAQTAADLIDDSFSDVVDDISKAASQSNAIENALTQSESIALDNPDSNIAAQSVSDLSSLNTNSKLEFDSAYENATELSSTISDNNGLAASGQLAVLDYEANYQDYISKLDIVKATDYPDQDSVDGQFAIVQAAADTTQDSSDSIPIITEQIHNNNSSANENITNIDNSIETINNYYEQASDVSGSVTDFLNNGETCVGELCVSNPDSETEPEEEESEEPLESAIYEYDPVYPDGVSSVLDDRISDFKAGAFYSFLNSFSVTISGVQPVFDIDTGIYGTYSLNVPSYVWDFIKLIILISCSFLCRRIIFGG